MPALRTTKTAPAPAVVRKVEITFQLSTRKPLSALPAAAPTFCAVFTHVVDSVWRVVPPKSLAAKYATIMIGERKSPAAEMTSPREIVDGARPAPAEAVMNNVTRITSWRCEDTVI